MKGGLAVAIGLTSADSMVVVENIARYLAECQTGDNAIVRASREVSGAVSGGIDRQHVDHAPADPGGLPGAAKTGRRPRD